MQETNGSFAYCEVKQLYALDEKIELAEFDLQYWQPIEEMGKKIKFETETTDSKLFLLKVVEDRFNDCFLCLTDEENHQEYRYLIPDQYLSETPQPLFLGDTEVIIPTLYDSTCTAYYREE